MYWSTLFGSKLIPLFVHKKNHHLYFLLHNGNFGLNVLWEILMFIKIRLSQITFRHNPILFKFMHIDTNHNSLVYFFDIIKLFWEKNTWDKNPIKTYMSSSTSESLLCSSWLENSSIPSKDIREEWPSKFWPISLSVRYISAMSSSSSRSCSSSSLTCNVQTVN